jgi:UDP-N-acetylmuramyl pentapeptide phosphotransferase/UDP-N-acetylglucosamine-1-phosphate transferase
MYNDGSVFIYREESLLISITLLFIPCIDVIRVALSRKIQGKRMFDADKTHIHHVLMQRGLSMRMTLAVIISLFVFISATNYLLYDFIPSTLIIIIDIIIYALFIYINKRQTK